VSQVLRAIGQEFLQTDTNGVDCGEVEAKKQRGFQLLNPTDDWFPGLAATKAHFSGSDWTLGKTPDFTVTRRILELDSQGGECQLEFKVIKGIIQPPVSASFSMGINPEVKTEFMSFLGTVEGIHFSPQLLHTVEKWGMKEKL